MLVTRFHYAPAYQYFCSSLLVKFQGNISDDGLSGKIGSHGSWQLRFIISISFHTIVSTPTLH